MACRHKRVEGIEAFNEGPVGAALLFDLLLDALGDLRDVVLEVSDRRVPFLVVRLAIAEEFLQQLDQIAAVAYVLIQPLPDAILDEDRALGRLEDDVVPWVALVELGADFLVQVVVLVLCLPEATRQMKGVDQRAVHLDEPGLGTVNRVFVMQSPLELAPAAGQEAAERVAHRHLVVNVELSELAQRFVIALHQLVRGL